MGKVSDFRRRKGIGETLKRQAIKLWSRVRPNKNPVRTIYMRHGPKEKGDPDAALLTPKGKESSEEAGRRSPPGKKLKIYHSDIPRAKQTGEHYAIGSRERGGKQFPATRERKQLSYYWGVIEKAKQDKEGQNISKRDLDKYIAERKAHYLELYTKIREPEFSKRWIAGDPEILDVLVPSTVVADELIWESRLGKRLDEKGAKGIDLGKFGHGGLPEFMLKRLTGKHFATDTIPANKTLDYNEELILEFRRGKVWLVFRNIRENVTKRYNEIIKEQKKIHKKE